MLTTIELLLSMKKVYNLIDLFRASTKIRIFATFAFLSIKYLESVINTSIRQKTARVNSKLKVPNRCLVYTVSFFWLSNFFPKLRNRVSSTSSKAIMRSNLVSFKKKLPVIVQYIKDSCGF